jgi:hypothetical protein
MSNWNANPHQTRSRRWRAGTRKNKKFKNVGSFRSDHAPRHA